MGNFRDLFKRVSSQLSEFWNAQSKARKGIMLGVVAALVGSLIALLTFSDSEEYEYVFVDLSSEDQQAITEYLKRNNMTKFQADSRGIKVPASEMLQLRLQLAQEGLPMHGTVGWEKFDTQEFARTEIETRIHKLRAIQGELQRTIMMIDKVSSARVHIVTPKKSLFIEEQQDPTAAIYIKTRRGVELDRKQIRGIVHLVSGSVEGLSPNNVTIIDAEGKMLTEIENNDPAAKMTKEMLGFKRQIEKRYEDNIRQIVGRIVGPDRVEVKVDTEIDFTQEKQTISDIDPDRATPISKETTGFNMSGSGLNPTGIPGSKSNVPGEQEEVNAASSQAKSKKESELINFEVKKMISEKTLPPVAVMKISAAVLVDGKQEYPIDGSKPVFEPRTEEELAHIEDLAKTAIGFTEKRGDSVTVRNLMFQLDPFQIETIKEEKEETREYIVTLVISAVSAAALVLFFAFIVRPYFRWLSYDPDRKKQQQVVEEFKPDLELGALQNVQIKEDVPFEKLTPQEQVLYLAKNEPKRTTEALRLLLNPHQTGG